MKDSIRYPNNPLRNKIQLKLRQVFGDLEIVDADTQLMLWPSADDFHSAEQTNPQNCGFKRAATRMCGSSGALVFGSAAYFDYTGKDGIRRIYRHIPSKLAHEAINTFDRDGAQAVPVDRAYVFNPPTKSHTRAYIKAHGKKLRTGPRKIIFQAWTSNAKCREANNKLKKDIADRDRQKERLQELAERMSPAATKVVETKKEIERLNAAIARDKERLSERRDIAAAQNKEAAKLREKPFQRKRVGGQVHHLNARNGIGFMSRVKQKLN